MFCKIGGICVCLLVLCCLVGCRNRDKNPAFSPADFHHEQMAVDTAYRLAASYPPGRTSFVLQENKGSLVFANALSAKLREMGFSVYEGDKMTSGIVLHPRVVFVDEREAVVVMSVGEQQLQRGYDLLDGDISPSSYWVRREA